MLFYLEIAVTKILLIRKICITGLVLIANSQGHRVLRSSPSHMSDLYFNPICDYLIYNLVLPFSIKPIAENFANDNKVHELQILHIVFAAFAQC
jgi:hypothetical protein